MAELGKRRKLQCVACSKEVWDGEDVCQYCGTKTFLRTATTTETPDETDISPENDENDDYNASYIPPTGWNLGPLLCNWAWLFCHRESVWGCLMLFLHLPVYLFTAIGLLQSVFDANPNERWNGIMGAAGFYLIGTAFLSVVGLPFIVRGNNIAWRSGRHREEFAADTQDEVRAISRRALTAVGICFAAFIFGSMQNARMEKAKLAGGGSVNYAASSVVAPKTTYQHYGFGYDTQRRIAVRDIQCPDCRGTGKSARKNLLGHYKDCDVCRGTGTCPLTVPLGPMPTDTTMMDMMSMDRERGQP